MLNRETINLVTDKKYTEFSELVKGELHSKLTSSEPIQTYNTSMEKISSLKTAFQAINQEIPQD